jgi:2-polyprenyl-3-methyl-5-hydroxy-6-metoxy-1,4-benzoquinol methylase
MFEPARNSRVERILALIGGPDVLDIGCCGGDATFLNLPIWLHKHILDGWPDTWGIDLSPERIKIMRELGYENVHVADAQEFDLGKQFDTIVAGEIIEHVENPAAFLRSAARHLKPDGSLIVTTPFPFAFANTAYALIKFPKTCSNDEHVAWFCPATMAQLASRLDLKVEHWELLDDYVKSINSASYRVLRALVRFLPRRLRSNSMLFVLRRRDQNSSRIVPYRVASAQ